MSFVTVFFEPYVESCFSKTLQWLEESFVFWVNACLNMLTNYRRSQSKFLLSYYKRFDTTICHESVHEMPLTTSLFLMFFLFIHRMSSYLLISEPHSIAFIRNCKYESRDFKYNYIARVAATGIVSTFSVSYSILLAKTRRWVNVL